LRIDVTAAVDSGFRRLSEVVANRRLVTRFVLKITDLCESFVEEIGFEKLDILSQRGIGHIRDAVDIIRENRSIVVDVHEVEKFKNDQRVKAQLKRGETIGCFYIESPALRGLLKKLRCDNYISLVAASSIIRPGVAKSGMMRQYIHRFHHPDQFEYLHPIMKEQLEETYGVMVYQEDVLKVCHHFAGLDLADADVTSAMAFQIGIASNTTVVSLDGNADDLPANTLILSAGSLPYFCSANPMTTSPMA
jgi:DNA polymerase III alpha subunit